MLWIGVAILLMRGIGTGNLLLVTSAIWLFIAVSFAMRTLFPLQIGALEDERFQMSYREALSSKEVWLRLFWGQWVQIFVIAFGLYFFLGAWRLPMMAIIGLVCIIAFGSFDMAKLQIERRRAVHS